MPQRYVKFHYCCIQILCKRANGMRKRLHIVGGYGEDAIASYCLLCQLTYKFELTILSLHIPDEPKLLLSGKTNNVVQPAWYIASPFSKYCNKTLNNKTI